MPSAGCAQPDAVFAQVGDNGTFASDGVDRVFSLEVPPNSRPNEPLPLVVNMHGARSTRLVQEQTSEFAALGRQQDFMVVAPQAQGDPPIWSISPGAADVGFLEKLIDEVETRLCVDTSRVYLTGISMGGMMSMVLACRHPDRYAAIAPVAGEIDIEDCRHDTPVPLLAFQGTGDQLVRFDGSFDPRVAARVPYQSGRSREQIVQSWASANGCETTAQDVAIPPDVEHQTYPCPQAGAVEFYVIGDGGHTWPGSTPGPYSAALAGKTTSTVDATQLIWEFFQQHTRTG